MFSGVVGGGLSLRWTDKEELRDYIFDGDKMGGVVVRATPGVGPTDNKEWFEIQERFIRGLPWVTERFGPGDRKSQHPIPGFSLRDAEGGSIQSTCDFIWYGAVGFGTVKELTMTREGKPYHPIIAIAYDPKADADLQD